MAKRRLKKTVARKLRLIVVTFFLILSCVLYNRVYSMNIVPFKYLKAILLILIGINLLSMLLLRLRKKIFKITGFISYVVLLLVCVIGIRYSNLTIRFLNKAFGNKKEFIVYEVVVLKDSKYSELADLKNKKIGYVDIDTNKYLDAIESKVTFNKEEYDLYTLYQNLMNGKLDGVVLNSSYLSLIEEQYPDINDKIKSLYMYDIEFETAEVKEVKELKPVTIYISGLDNRSGKVEAVGKSDVNMLVTINPKTNKILLTGIPRDYFVQLHGTTGLRDKLTHAGTYGIQMSKTTIEDIMGIKIDYTIKVGFNSVVDVVDLIGGIDIESNKGFWSFHLSGWYVEEGMNHMNGKQALAYARERQAYPDADEHRVRNHQQVFEAVFTKMFTNKKMLFKYDTLLNELSDLYTTDIPKSFVTLLIKQQIDGMKSWSIVKQSVTGTGKLTECYSIKGIDVMVMEPDMDSVKEARKKIEEVLNEK